MSTEAPARPDYPTPPFLLINNKGIVGYGILNIAMTGLDYPTPLYSVHDVVMGYPIHVEDVVFKKLCSKAGYPLCYPL